MSRCAASRSCRIGIVTIPRLWLATYRTSPSTLHGSILFLTLPLTSIPLLTPETVPTLSDQYPNAIFTSISGWLCSHTHVTIVFCTEFFKKLHCQRFVSGFLSAKKAESLLYIFASHGYHLCSISGINCMAIAKPPPNPVIQVYPSRIILPSVPPYIHSNSMKIPECWASLPKKVVPSALRHPSRKVSGKHSCQIYPW